MRKNIKIKIKGRCIGSRYDIALCKGDEVLMENPDESWRTIKAATRNAKKLAAVTGIPFEAEIIKQRGC